MSVAPVTFFVFISFCFYCSVTGQQIFKDDPDQQCMTPHNKPGHCVPLHNCPYMYQVFRMRYAISDEHTKRYLEKSLCRLDGKMPIVCCEQDAGACVTPEETSGACVPFIRCDPFLYYVNENLFTNDQIVHYFRKSTCIYGKEDQPRVCCPIFTMNITLQTIKKDNVFSTVTSDSFTHSDLKPNTAQSIKPVSTPTQEPSYNLNPDRLGSSIPTSVLNKTTNPVEIKVANLIPNSSYAGRPMVSNPVSNREQSLGFNTQTKHSVVSPVSVVQPSPNLTPKPSSTPKTNIRGDILPTPGDEEGSCGSQKYEDILASIGGNETSIYEYPWLALLQAGDGSFPCGGSLITKRYVLTAAHCVLGETVKKMKNITSIRLGEWDISSKRDCMEDFERFECTDDPLNIEVEEIVPHPEYNHETLQHDIALIRLKTPAPYTDFIRPICLPIKKNENSSPPYTIAGWGATQTERYSKIKLHVTGLPVYSKEKCMEVYSKINPHSKVIIGAEHICVGGKNGRGSCPEDSGGPLMTSSFWSGTKWGNTKVYFQVGVISFGYTVCGFENIPSIYTNVEEYIDWITKNMRI